MGWCSGLNRRRSEAAPLGMLDEHNYLTGPASLNQLRLIEVSRVLNRASPRSES
jgi:hypothetical protein